MAEFKAALHHDLRNEMLYRLPHLVNRRWEGFRELWEAWESCSSATEWRWQRDRGFSSFPEQFFELGFGVLRGPHGFDVTVGRHALELKHKSSWWQFFGNEGMLQDKLRATVRLFCGLLGSPVALYFPGGEEDGTIARMVREDHSLNDVIVRLQTAVGLPKPSIEDMLVPAAGGWVADGYFIDDFLDVDRLQRLEGRRQLHLAYV